MSKTVTAGAVLLTLDDLAQRWQAQGATEKARRKWLWRRIHDWGVPWGGTRNEPRFLPAAVMLCEQRSLGGGLVG